MFWLPLTFFRTLPFLHQYNERNMFRIWSTNSNFFVKKEDHARRSSIHKQGKTNIMSSCLLIFVRIIIIVKRRGLFICRHMLTPQSHFYKILSLQWQARNIIIKGLLAKREIPIGPNIRRIPFHGKYKGRVECANYICF